MRTELKDNLLKKIAVKLEPYDFKLVRAMDYFVKKSGKDKLFYNISFHLLDSGYGICLGLGIRIDEVEKIYHEACNTEKQFRPHTSTFGNAIREWQREGIQYEYSLLSFNDIDELVESFYDVFIKIVLPFFEKNYSLKAIDKLLNDEEKRLYEPIYSDYYKGIIVAKLIERNNYPQLVEIYREKLKEIAGNFYLTNYEKIIDALD